MLLVASVGNTNVRLGWFEEGDEPVAVQSAPVGELERLEMPAAPVEALVLGSVNPLAAGRLRARARERLACPVLELRVELPVPLRFACDDAGHVGADRVANAIALHRRTGRGGVAVDFGTALSLVVVSPQGEFLGGAIAPGLAMSARALYTETALLPLVGPTAEACPERSQRGGGATWPAPTLSCRTETAIASGLLWGLAGMADRLVERLAEPWPDAVVLATGGDAPRIVPFCRRICTIVPHLTLEGLRHAYLQRPR